MYPEVKGAVCEGQKLEQFQTVIKNAINEIACCKDTYSQSTSPRKQTEATLVSVALADTKPPVFRVLRILLRDEATTDACVLAVRSQRRGHLTGSPHREVI